MLKSLALLKNGVFGSTLSSSSPQSSCLESKNQASESKESVLKEDVLSRIRAATSDMPQQKIILSAIRPMLTQTTETDLLDLIRNVYGELEGILSKHDPDFYCDEND